MRPPRGKGGMPHMFSNRLHKHFAERAILGFLVKREKGVAI
jgi:hypothetical protein